MPFLATIVFINFFHFQSLMISPSLNYRKPIKLQMNCQQFKRKSAPQKDPICQQIIKQMEENISQQNPLPLKLAQKVLSYLKDRESRLNFTKKSASQRESENMQGNEQMQNFSKSKVSQSCFSPSNCVLEDRSNSMIYENKQALMGRIKLVKIVNNKKIDVGESQVASVVSTNIIVRNMRQKFNKVEKQKQKYQNKVEQLQKKIEQMKESPKSHQTHNNSQIQDQIKLEFVFEINVKEEKSQPKIKSESYPSQDESLKIQYQNQMVGHMKNVMILQSVEIENLSHKLATKKQNTKSRWANS